ncbi:hypothetical protein M0802_002140 [Mischocyttarus mexicanus]|nr:hypothetical protein M0802_002140 [Mischocyttarus mexicanus]
METNKRDRVCWKESKKKKVYGVWVQEEEDEEEEEEEEEGLGGRYNLKLEVSNYLESSYTDVEVNLYRLEFAEQIGINFSGNSIVLIAFKSSIKKLFKKETEGPKKGLECRLWEWKGRCFGGRRKEEEGSTKYGRKYTMGTLWVAVKSRRREQEQEEEEEEEEDEKENGVLFETREIKGESFRIFTEYYQEHFMRIAFREMQQQQQQQQHPTAKVPIVTRP